MNENNLKQRQIEASIARLATSPILRMNLRKTILESEWQAITRIQWRLDDDKSETDPIVKYIYFMIGNAISLRLHENKVAHLPCKGGQTSSFW